MIRKEIIEAKKSSIMRTGVFIPGKCRIPKCDTKKFTVWSLIYPLSSHVTIIYYDIYILSPTLSGSDIFYAVGMAAAQQF